MSNRFQGWLPGFSGINVEVTIPVQNDKRKFQVEVNLSPRAIKNFKAFVPETEGITPLTYFKIRYENGEPKTTFAPPLKLHVRYSERDWNKSATSGLGDGRPRVYYLKKDDTDKWVGDWVEFLVDKDNVKTPDDEYSYGHLYIEIKDLPDPKIGGC